MAYKRKYQNQENQTNNQRNNQKSPVLCQVFSDGQEKLQLSVRLVAALLVVVFEEVSGRKVKKWVSELVGLSGCLISRVLRSELYCISGV